MNNHFSKKYGQVFLSDKNLADKEVRSLNLNLNDNVLEIGPGYGILTDILLKYDIKLTSIEPDHKFYNYLSEKYNNYIKEKKFNLIKGNFLEMEPEYYNKIIGNIPYNISSKIIFKLFDFDFDYSIFMVQKEFALRLIAKPGTKDFSRLTVNAGIRSEIKILFNVTRKVFSPVPDVDSSVISIKKKKCDIDIINFNKFLIKIFSMRRKKLSTILNYNGIFSDKRPYELSIDDLIKVYYRN